MPPTLSQQRLLTGQRRCRSPLQALIFLSLLPVGPGPRPSLVSLPLRLSFHSLIRPRAIPSPFLWLRELISKIGVRTVPTVESFCEDKKDLHGAVTGTHQGIRKPSPTSFSMATH